MIFAIMGLVMLILIHSFRSSNRITKALALFILFNKGIEIAYGLAQGNINKIPIEYSTITYFLLPIAILCKKEQLKKIFSFMGFLSGIGYLLTFIFAGSTIYEINGMYHTIQGFINHSILYALSVQVMKEQPLAKIEIKIWLTTVFLVYYMVAISMIIDYSESVLFIREVLTGSSIISRLNHWLHFDVRLIYYLGVAGIYHILIKTYKYLNCYQFRKSIIKEQSRYEYPV